MSVVTFTRPGRAAILAWSCWAFWYNAWMSGLWRVNWYWLFESRPPMRIGGGFWRNTWIPGMEASLAL